MKLFLYLLLFIAVAVFQESPAQTYMGAVDASRGFMDRWFYLFGRMEGGNFALSDSVSIFPNFINLRYHVDDAAVYWLFDEPGRYPDSTVSLLKIPIVDGRFQKGTRVELKIGECPGISGCEFINNDGRYVLNCAKSGVEVDLMTLAVRRL